MEPTKEEFIEYWMELTREELIDRLAIWHNQNWGGYWSSDINQLNNAHMFAERDMQTEVLINTNWDLSKAKAEIRAHLRDLDWKDNYDDEGSLI